MLKFKVDESSNCAEEVVIRLTGTNEDFKESIGMVFGSLNVFKARLMNLSFASFLRMCRDVYGAELRGNTGFTYPVWTNRDDCELLTKELNKRLKQIL